MFEAVEGGGAQLVRRKRVSLRGLVSEKAAALRAHKFLQANHNCGWISDSINKLGF